MTLKHNLIMFARVRIVAFNFAPQIFLYPNLKLLSSYDSSYAPKIISVEFEDGSVCESIGEFAFRYCESLTSITIPDSVTSIGDYAFEDCTSLTDVYYTGSEEDWAKISIDSSNTKLTNATIHYNYKAE